MKTHLGHLTVYQIKLTALTPVFVGSGQKLNRTEYIYDIRNKTVYIVDEAKLGLFLEQRKLWDEFIDYIKADSEKNNSTKGNKTRDGNRQTQNPNENTVHLSEWLYSKGVTNYSALAAQVIDASEVTRDDLNDLHLFIRNAEGNPYIPGSAIKGAIRAILVKQHFYTSDTKQNWLETKEFITNNGVKKRELRQLGSQWENKFTHTVPIENVKWTSALRDVFRGLEVSDTLPLTPDKLFISRQLRLSTYPRNGHLKELPLYLEYLRPGTKLKCTITINREFFSHSLWENMNGIVDVLKKTGARLEKLLGEPHFRNLGYEYHWSYDSSLKPNFWLGGQTGWQTKVFWPELAPNEESYLNTTKRILQALYTKPDHEHIELDRTVSPRTLKLASYEGKLYICGMCRLEVEEL